MEDAITFWPTVGAVDPNQDETSDLNAPVKSVERTT
jgi:hypothetical protein